MEVHDFDLAKYFTLPNPRLMTYLGRVKKGSSVDIRTPFWDGKPREEVLSLWDSRFDSFHVDKVVPGLEAFEKGMRDKVGPLSVMLPLEQRLDSIREYYKAIELPSQPIIQPAIERVKAKLRGIKIRRRDWKATVEKMKLSTNSGAPDFTERRKVASRKRSWLGYPAVLGWRGQEGGPEVDDVKQRVVWMFPFSTNEQELSVYTPLIEAWQARSVNSAYMSMRAVEVKITNLFRTKGDEYVVVTDFSKFDQHFNSALQQAAEELVAYQVESPEEWVSTVFPVKFNIPLVCSPNLMFTGPHGMGSGSGGTNFDECCAHSAMQEEVAILNGAALNPFSNAYGDDGYLSFKGIDVDKVISAYTSHGQVMNPDKQYVDKHSTLYLRRYFHDSYRDSKGVMLGIYSTYRALGRLLGQERYIPFEEGSKDYARYSILRALSIVENCANHPFFNSFVDFVISGDKYKLGLAYPGFLDSLPKQVEEFREKDPDILGYTKELQRVHLGINSWKVVQYLRSKA